MITLIKSKVLYAAGLMALVITNACSGSYVTIRHVTLSPQPTKASPAGGSLNERRITITNAAALADRRTRLIRFIWGENGYRERMPIAVQRASESPVDGLSNLKRVDTLTIAMDHGVTSYAHHFIPRTNTRQRLVILHHGHSCTFNDVPGDTDEGYGMQRTIYSLLSRGYSVLAVYMPYKATFSGVNTCNLRTHDSLFGLRPSQGSPMKYFLDPVAVSLNYLEARYSADFFPRYKRYDMIGLSGGGWTVTVYPAVDTRIKLSFPIAGSMPLYLERKDRRPLDKEYNYSDFYEIAGYLDLYVLASAGAGRKQIQILNRWDDCCYGQAQHDAARSGSTYDEAVRDYESRVRKVLSSLGFDDAFRVHIDNKAPHHTISRHTIRAILRELDSASSRETNRRSRP